MDAHEKYNFRRVHKYTQHFHKHFLTKSFNGGDVRLRLLKNFKGKYGVDPLPTMVGGGPTSFTEIRSIIEVLTNKMSYYESPWSSFIESIFLMFFELFFISYLGASKMVFHTLRSHNVFSCLAAS